MPDYTSSNYHEIGGARFVVGGELDIVSGGDLDIESGATWRIAGVIVTASAAAINAAGDETGTGNSTWTIDNDSSGGTIVIGKVGDGTDHAYTISTPALSGAPVTVTMPASTGTIALTTDTQTDLDLGSSGTAGSLDIFPTTGANGKLIITATDMGGARNLAITNAAIAGARAYTIPDAGGDGQFVMTTTDHKCLVNANAATRTVSLSGDLTTGADVTFSGAFAAQLTVPSASTWVLPSGGGTLATVTGAETGTTSSTFTVDSDGVTGKLAIVNTTGGTNSTVTLQTTQTTQAVTLTLPDVAADTLVAKTTTDTLTNKTLTAPEINGCTAASGNFDQSGSAGTFKTCTGSNSIGGHMTIAANKNVDCDGGSTAVDLSGGTGTFQTTTGTNTFQGAIVVATGKGITHSGGTSNIDFSASDGTFLTTTGTVTIGGTVSLAADKNVACAAGTSTIDWSLGTGGFKSPSGANQLTGPVTIADATTPSLTCAAGKTNSGFVSVLGTTDGGIKILPIDAGTSLLTISQEAQTQACTMLVPDLNVATGQFVCNAADQTVRFVSGASDRTVTLGGDITTTGDFLTVGDDSVTLTTSAATDVTLPTTGTLASLGGVETLTNKTIDGDDNTIQDLRAASPGDIVARETAVTAVPAIPFVVTFTPRDDAGETLAYVVPAGKTLRVLDVRGYKTHGNGGGGDTVQVTNVGNAITDAIVTNLNDKLIFEAATYDDAFRDVAATTELRVTTAFNTDCACSVNVLCVWV